MTQGTQPRNFGFRSPRADDRRHAGRRCDGPEGSAHRRRARRAGSSRSASSSSASHVTVGPSEKNMFVVGDAGLPASFRLFELVGNDYHLNFLDGMTGRVALPTGISDLAVLRGQARRSPQGAYQVRLTEDSRGKVVVGDDDVPLPVRRAAAGAAEAAASGCGAARRAGHRLEHDDDRGVVVPLSLPRARLDLLGLARSGDRRRGQRREPDRFAEDRCRLRLLPRKRNRHPTRRRRKRLPKRLRKRPRRPARRLPPTRAR